MKTKSERRIVLRLKFKVFWNEKSNDEIEADRERSMFTERPQVDLICAGKKLARQTYRMRETGNK